MLRIWESRNRIRIKKESIKKWELVETNKINKFEFARKLTFTLLTI